MGRKSSVRRVNPGVRGNPLKQIMLRHERAESLRKSWARFADFPADDRRVNRAVHHPAAPGSLDATGRRHREAAGEDDQKSEQKNQGLQCSHLAHAVSPPFTAVRVFW